jgi:hypothetical protein
MDLFTASWLLWIAAFAVIEGIALRNRRPGDTLSEHVWEWFAIGRPGKPRPPLTGSVQIRRFALLAFMAWLSVHFLTGGFI